MAYQCFGYFTDNTGQYQAKPHNSSIIKLKEKLKRLTCRSWNISLDDRLKKTKQQISGWVHYFRIVKMKTALSKIDEHLHKRIRVVIWKQWKTTTKRYNSLKQLGAKHELAFQTANCRKSYQYVGVNE